MITREDVSDVQVGDSVLVDGEWFFVEEVARSEQALFGSDDDGGDRYISFSRVDMVMVKG